MTCLGTAKKAFADDMYDQVLERYAAWDDAVSDGVMDNALEFPDLESRLLPSCVLYSKLLYGSYGGTNEAITIKKPSLQTLLKGMMSRLAKHRLVFNGTFYELDPLRQDYALRDIFRQALYDCIEIVEEKREEPKKEPVVAVMPVLPSPSPKASVIQSVSPAPVVGEELSDDDEIYPDDSISRVMENLTNVVKQRDARDAREPLSKIPSAAASAIPPSVIQMEGASKVSAASRVTSGTKTMRIPVDVRRVTIENEDKH